MNFSPTSASDQHGTRMLRRSMQAMACRQRSGTSDLPISSHIKFGLGMVAYSSSDAVVGAPFGDLLAAMELRIVHLRTH